MELNKCTRAYPYPYIESLRGLARKNLWKQWITLQRGASVMAEWECDICGLTPCLNRSFCKACLQDRPQSDLPAGGARTEARFSGAGAINQGCHRLAAAVHHRNRLPRWYIKFIRGWGMSKPSPTKS